MALAISRGSRIRLLRNTVSKMIGVLAQSSS
jgi:hypothetical protein